MVAGVAGSKTTNHQSQYHRCHGEGNTIWSCSPICKRSVAQQNSYKGIHVRTLECFFWHATNCHDIHHFPYKAKHVIHSFSVIQFKSAFGESFPATLWPERFRKRNPGLCLTLGFPDGVDPVKRHVTLILIDRFFSKQVWGWESESQQLDIQYHRRGFEGSRCKSCLRGGWMELSSDTCSVLVYWAKPWDTHIRKLFWDWPEHWHCLQVCDVLGNDVVYCIFIDDRQR